MSRQLQYVLSADLWNQHCFYDADKNLNVAIQADANMKIKLRLRSVHVQQLHSVSIEYADNEEIEIPLNNGEITEVPVDQLTLKLSNQDNVFLIGFQGEFQVMLTIFFIEIINGEKLLDAMTWQPLPMPG